MASRIFPGYKLRDGYRQVTFLDRSQVDQIKIIHTQDIISWYDFLANHERDEQRKQIERPRVGTCAYHR
jgi:hypothetical protein